MPRRMTEELADALCDLEQARYNRWDNLPGGERPRWILNCEIKRCADIAKSLGATRRELVGAGITSRPPWMSTELFRYSSERGRRDGWIIDDE